MYNDTALTEMGEHIAGLITHMQLHSAGTSATAGTVGGRFAVTTTLAGRIATYTATVTGLPPSTPITYISYWSAATGGTNYGGTSTFAGDTAASNAGEYDVTVVETGFAG